MNKNIVFAFIFVAFSYIGPIFINQPFFTAAGFELLGSNYIPVVTVLGFAFMFVFPVLGLLFAIKNIKHLNGTPDSHIVAKLIAWLVLLLSGYLVVSYVLLAIVFGMISFTGP